MPELPKVERNSFVPDPSGPAGQTDNTADVAAQPTQVAQPSSTEHGFTFSEIIFGGDGVRAGWGILLFFVLCTVLFFCMSVVQGALPRSNNTVALNTPRGMLLSEGRELFVVVLATFGMAVIERRSITAYGLGRARCLRNFVAGLAWGLTLLSLLVFTLHVTGLLVFDARLLHGASALRYGVLWLAGFMLVGLFEETIFRGYLQFTLARGIDGVYNWIRATDPHTTGIRTTSNRAFGFWSAALLLSFGFGFVHQSNTGESPIGLLAAGIIGVVFCLSLWRTGSLWWAIGFHAAWDWAQSFLYGVSDSGIAIQCHLFATHPVGRAILSGGLTGPEGSLFILPIVALTVVAIVLTLPRAQRDVAPPETAIHTRAAAGLDLQ
jgi:membrane protease YdiL (CAAX protease family)